MNENTNQRTFKPEWNLYQYKIDHVPKGHVLSIIDQSGEVIHARLIPSQETISEYKKMLRQERGF